MVALPCDFGPVVTQYIMDGENMWYCSWAVKETDRKGPGSQYTLQGHTPNDPLPSIRLHPLTCHRLVTNPLTHGLSGTFTIQTKANMRHKG
jgi:hypothetical protein